MRIAHVVVTGAWAGVEAHVARLARAQAGLGHTVAIVGGSPPDIQRHAGPGVLFKEGATIPKAWASLCRLPWTPTVVHAHMTAAELAGTLYPPVLRRKVPLVVTRHLALRRGTTRPGQVASLLIRRRVAGQIAISSHTAAHVDGLSTVILAGVEPAPNLADPSSSKTILVAARLEPEKRVDLAVRAFGLSGRAKQGWRLTVAGDGACRGSIESLIIELGLQDSVTLLGYSSDVRLLMAHAAIFLAPTPQEGLGLSVIEAMAAGLPIVADGSGGHLESLGSDGRIGLYRTLDIGSAAERLRILTDDSQLRVAYGAALHRRQSELFTLDAQAKATDEFYRTVLK